MEESLFYNSTRGNRISCVRQRRPNDSDNSINQRRSKDRELRAL
jgi:hypothetical protein